MQGGTISFRAREKQLDGWTVDFRFKSSFIDGFGDYFYWNCLSGDCGYETYRSIGPVDNRTSFPSRWYQYEGRITRRVQNDNPFQLTESSCCWVSNLYSVSGWQLTSSVDLGIRSDTKKPNSSPVTTTIPIIRIPQNCATTVSLLAHDSDGDSVRCRYGYRYGECSSCYSLFALDENRCTLAVSSWMTIGSYVLELVLEDFPSKDIRLTYNDGTMRHKYRTHNRKIREVPKKYQKYYWYGTTSDTWVSDQQTVMEGLDDITKIPYTTWNDQTIAMTNADIYVTESFTDTATESASETVPETDTTLQDERDTPTDSHRETTLEPTTTLHVTQDERGTSTESRRPTSAELTTTLHVTQDERGTSTESRRPTSTEPTTTLHVTQDERGTSTESHRPTSAEPTTTLHVTQDKRGTSTESHRPTSTEPTTTLHVTQDERGTSTDSRRPTSAELTTTLHVTQDERGTSTESRRPTSTEPTTTLHVTQDERGTSTESHRPTSAELTTTLHVTQDERGTSTESRRPTSTEPTTTLHVTQDERGTSTESRRLTTAEPTTTLHVTQDERGTSTESRRPTAAEPMTTLHVTQDERGTSTESRRPTTAEPTTTLHVTQDERGTSTESRRPTAAKPTTTLHVTQDERGTSTESHRPTSAEPTTTLHVTQDERGTSTESRRPTTAEPTTTLHVTQDERGTSTESRRPTAAKPTTTLHVTQDERGTSTESHRPTSAEPTTTLHVTQDERVTSTESRRPTTAELTTTLHVTQDERGTSTESRRPTAAEPITTLHVTQDEKSTSSESDRKTATVPATTLHVTKNDRSTSTEYGRKTATVPATTLHVTKNDRSTSTEYGRKTATVPATTLHVVNITTAELVKVSTERIITEAVTFPYKTTEMNLYPTSFPSITTDSLSKISLQFIVEVNNPVPSCIFGDYRPRFLPPTPNQGERLLTNVESVFQLHLSAHATYESITDFKVSGPSGITKSLTVISRSNTRSMTVEWTPGENELGDHVPFCFVAETTNGYQSVMRCVIVVVGPSKLVNTILTCHENTMTLIIEESPDNGLYENHFRLNDPICLVTSNSTHLIASVGYNSCGTEIEETEHNIVFKNQVTSFANTSSVITRRHGVSIPFNCSFPKKTRLSASFLAHKSDYMFSEAGFGNFTYKFQFYTDDLFVEVETHYPLEVTLRDPLYMEIQVSSAVPNVQLFVESCKATPHDNPNDPVFYDIIKNGCINDDTLMTYPGTRTQYRFAVEAFAFIGSYEEVYISCTVILCKLGEPDTRCSQGCVRNSLGDSNGRRRRRSIVSESQQHFISQGPLRMRRPSPSDAGDTHSLNVNTLVIALSGVVIVAVVAVTVHMYMQKSRSTGYERFNTEYL
ncbi:uncharacterized protein LOC134968978 [Pseudophryne corroboree]|uniref:uncharacterized protein LOC134968978 n=1 Tax=Pseudophryne corroboree TaxID=495146 RepID=UPI0030821BBF